MKTVTLFTAVLGTIAFVSPCVASSIYLSTGSTVKEYGPGGAVSTISTTIGGGGLAFGPNGNLYVADGGSFIFEFSPGGGATQIANNSGLLNGDLGMVFDSSGNLYVGQDFTNSLTKLTPGGTLSQFNPNMNAGPKQTAVDSSGNFYSAMDTGQIVKTTSAGSNSVFTSSLSRTEGIAIDNSGNIFVSDYNTGQIDEFASGGSAHSIFASSLSGPGRLTFDSAGDLFVVTNNNIMEFANGSQTATVFATVSGMTAFNSFIVASSTDIAGTPEPASWTFLAIGGLALAFGRRKVGRRS